jgi:RecA-family ATPase
MAIPSNLKIEENPFAQKLGVKEWQEREFIQPKPSEYLIDELVPANSLVCLQTDEVYGKTTLAVQLAMSVAFDVPFLKRYHCLQPGKVLFINGRDSDGDCHRRFKRLVRELSRTEPDLPVRIDTHLDNFTHISLFDECYGLKPQLIDGSGGMTKTYTYLQQFSDYFKTKLIVLDPVEDFFPDNLKNISELYIKLRQIRSTILLVVGDRQRYGEFHEVEVSMSILENVLRVQSDYLGHRDIGVSMGAGIWHPTT